MGILELLVGLIIFILLANIVFAFVPVPRNIAGAIIAVLILILLWSLVF